MYVYIYMNCSYNGMCCNRDAKLIRKDICIYIYNIIFNSQKMRISSLSYPYWNGHVWISSMCRGSREHGDWTGRGRWRATLGNVRRLAGLLCGLEPPVGKDMTGRQTSVVHALPYFSGIYHLWGAWLLFKIQLPRSVAPDRLDGCSKLNILSLGHNNISDLKLSLPYETLHPCFIVFRFGNSHLKFYYTQTCRIFFEVQVGAVQVARNFGSHPRPP
jgi:hypothetical protein